MVKKEVEHPVTWEQVICYGFVLFILFAFFIMGYGLTIPGQTEITISFNDGTCPTVIPAWLSNVPFGIVSMLIPIMFGLVLMR